jgi:hypothetical protein
VFVSLIVLVLLSLQVMPPECIVYQQKPSIEVKLMMDVFRVNAKGSSKHVVDDNNYVIKPPKLESHLLKLVTAVC